MSMTFYIAIIIFIVTYAAIILDKVPHTLCALVGGGLMIYLGLVTQDTAIKKFIDFNTLGLLAGMMVLISIVRRSGFFEAMALWAVKKSKGRAKELLVLLAVITGIGAALIDSVTVALLIAPMTLSICRMVSLNPMPLLITEILASNIGGTALMIGNPPNVMIGSASGLDFMQFVKCLAPAVLITLVITIAVMVLIYNKSLTSKKLTPEELEAIHIRDAVKDMAILKKSLTVLGLTIIGFMIHSFFGLQSATVALTGAVIATIICHIDSRRSAERNQYEYTSFLYRPFYTCRWIRNSWCHSSCS